MNSNWSQNKILITATVAFIFSFFFMCYIQPNCFFKKDGSIRSFGIGYKNKTVIPIWIVSIVLAIFCYVGASFYFLRF